MTDYIIVVSRCGAKCNHDKNFLIKFFHLFCLFFCFSVSGFLLYKLYFCGFLFFCMKKTKKKRKVFNWSKAHNKYTFSFTSRIKVVKLGIRTDFFFYFKSIRYNFLFFCGKNRNNGDEKSGTQKNNKRRR